MFGFLCRLMERLGASSERSETVYSDDALAGDVEPLDIELAVKRGEERREQALRRQEEEVERKRSLVSAKFGDHVSRLIAHIPHIIEESVARHKGTSQGTCGIYRLIEIERVNIREMRNHDCGLAYPAPGTYVEYLHNRLKEAGLQPECAYDNNAFGWYGMMCIYKPKSNTTS